MRSPAPRLTAFRLAALLATVVASAARAQSVDDLRHMSVSELANLDVSSMSKTTESLADAPGAIFVITHDDIVRSGATSLAEILRLAPNLQVAQTAAGRHVVTARGFSGNANAQSFSNKLLVLIDGRSVYTPLFSGVYWDMQDVLLQDVDRIEVISGPGATLWGANAVNGVINVITRKSGATQGGLVQVQAGDLGRGLALRYGGRIGEDLAYRIYAKSFVGEDTVTSAGDKAHDQWSKPQAGFRLDWTPSADDALTLQGDGYEGSEAQGGAMDEQISGRNLLLRWNRSGESGSDLQVQAYYDRTRRETRGNGSFTLDTYDLDLQHSFRLGARSQIVWGGGYRISRYRIESAGGLQFQPPSRTLDLTNLFVQDSISITDATRLTLGLKLEDDPYSGLSALPSVRLSWKPAETAMLWAAVSRAIRSPTPFDRDVVEKVGAVTFLTGDPDFKPETLTAYEAGLRLSPSSRASISVSAFYDDYGDLRSIEPAPGGFIPLRWGNEMRGHTQGLEAWGDYRATPWWRLSAAVTLLDKHLSFSPRGSGLLGVSQAGDDPKVQASLKSSMNLGPDVTLDAHLRHVGALPAPRVPAYTELNARLGWHVTDKVQLSLTGYNLLHEQHQEFPAPQANAVPRRFLIDLQWRF